MRRVLAAVAVLAALAMLWLAADAWRASRIPRLGRPLEPAIPVSSSPPPAPETTRPAPEPASGARLAIDWQDPNGQMYHSEIALEPDVRAPVAATVITRDRASGQELVRYRTRATRLASGTLIIDAEGATVSGPYAADWSPDSFTITSDGQVTTQDAQSSPGTGWVVQQDAFTPGK